MALSNLVILGNTYNSVGTDGEYILSTIQFGQPKIGFKLSPGRKSGANGPVQFSVTRFVEFVDPVTAKMQRVSWTNSCSVPVSKPEDVSVDFGFDALAAALTPELINYLLLGGK